MCNVITDKDGLIWELLKDPKYKVKKDGSILKKSAGKWEKRGYVSRSRRGTKNYIRVHYRGVRIYAHRIVWAAFNGFLNANLTVNHKDLNGLNNHIENLELVPAAQNLRHAKGAYRRMGLTAAEAKANWVKGKKTKFKWSGVNGR